MLVLIADSGSTKTDWALVKGSELVLRFSSIGFNPYFQDKDVIKREVLAEVKPKLKNYASDIQQLFYYGTGCSTIENCKLIQDAMTEALHIQKVEVAHDLLAAARALCKHNWGIAAILGTGSNSCLYDGEQILENVPSAGYLWSDYGGGSQIGKYFMQHYFESTLPTELLQAFEAAGYNRETILNNVYKKGVPGKYLAGVSLFIGQHMQHPFVKELLARCFDTFFLHQVNHYSNAKKYKVHTVGSIGFYYKDTIAEVAKKHGYQMGTVIKSPMEGLIEYHST